MHCRTYTSQFCLKVPKVHPSQELSDLLDIVTPKQHHLGLHVLVIPTRAFEQILRLECSQPFTSPIRNPFPRTLRLTHPQQERQDTDLCATIFRCPERRRSWKSCRASIPPPASTARSMAVGSAAWAQWAGTTPWVVVSPTLGVTLPAHRRICSFEGCDRGVLIYHRRDSCPQAVAHFNLSLQEN